MRGLREGRVYSIGGIRVPSVTEILAFKGYSDFSFLSPLKLAQVQQRGTDVHKLCENLDYKRLDWADVPDEYIPYVEGYEEFRRDEQSYKPVDVERPVFHPRLMYAGTLDRYCTFRGFPTILDLKTGPLRESVALQLAGYALGHFADEDGEIAERCIRNPEVGLQRFALRLLKERGPDGKRYELREYADERDYAVFQSEVPGAHWKLEHGLVKWAA